jgi:type IV pilus assembly protein PilA
MVHTNSVRRHARGFTLVELLVVTLILSILMAVALPLYLSAVKDSRIKTNRANMQTIANAVQAAFVKTPQADYSGFAGDVSSAKEPDLQTVPVGPNGNEKYTIVPTTVNNNPSFYVKCDPADEATGSTTPVNGAGTFTPGADNQ